MVAGTPDWPSLVSPSMVSVFVGRRLTMTLLPPALKWILKLKTAVEVDEVSRREKRKPNEQQKTTSSGRSFTTVQMFNPHTHCMRSGTFGLKSAHTGDKGGGSNDSWPLNSLRMVISARTSIEEIWQLLWCHCWMFTG